MANCRAHSNTERGPPPRRNRYAEMVRWMAWPRIKNSRSSAQPGSDTQATVTPAPDAEPNAGSGQNIGVSGATRAVAQDAGHSGAGAEGTGTGNTAGGNQGRRPRLRAPIRYAHSAA